MDIKDDDDRDLTLVDRAGVLVHHGPRTTEIDVAIFVRCEREARAQHGVPARR